MIFHSYINSFDDYRIYNILEIVLLFRYYNYTHITSNFDFQKVNPAPSSNPTRKDNIFLNISGCVQERVLSKINSVAKPPLDLQVLGVTAVKKSPLTSREEPSS